MKFATYLLNGKEKLGILNSEMTGVYDFEVIELEKNYIDMNDFISNVTENDINILKSRNYEKSDCIKAIELKDIKLCSPIVNPVNDVLCLGLNYKDHVEETKRRFNANYE